MAPFLVLGVVPSHNLLRAGKNHPKAIIPLPIKMIISFLPLPYHKPALQIKIDGSGIGNNHIKLYPRGMKPQEPQSEHQQSCSETMAVVGWENADSHDVSLRSRLHVLRRCIFWRMRGCVVRLGLRLGGGGRVLEGDPRRCKANQLKITHLKIKDLLGKFRSAKTLTKMKIS